MKNTLLHILLIVGLSISLNAKDIYVKYRGVVNIDNGHFNKLSIKESSLVKNMYYDDNNEYLLVQLKNTYYHYCSIPMTIIHSWVEAQSLGKYYNSFIRGQYDCRIYPVPNY